ncbi:hypothetical protein GF389_04045 [Candidatus Dojkabacteria bacterium]|nr:hypothetical protein [Candidatus Dojkabacteria bacterium]
MKYFWEQFMKFLKALLILAAFSYAVLTLYTVVFDFLLVLKTFFELTGLNSGYFLTDSVQGSQEAASIYDYAFYNITYVISILVSILGMIILSRRRNILEAIGILMAFIIPAERRSWGRVLSSSDGAPVPFAQIYLEPNNNQLSVIKTIADSDGRYKLVLPDSKYSYRLTVRAPGYKDFQIDIKSTDSPVYGNEYIRDIFMQKVDEEKRTLLIRFSQFQVRFYWYLTLTLFALSFMYFLFALYYVYAFPGSLYGALNLAIMIFALSWNVVVIRERIRPKIGKVLDLKTHKPIPRVSVYIYKDSKQSGVRTTDYNGVVNFGAAPGEYDIRLAKEGYVNASGETFQRVKLKKDGFLEGNLFMLKDEDIDSSPSSNPFA